MAGLSQFDSRIVRFGKPPMLRSWPTIEGLRALFEACVAELIQLCRRDRSTWLTHADLAAMLYTILAQELPAHGLAPRSLHAGLELAAKPPNDARPRHRRPSPQMTRDRAIAESASTSLSCIQTRSPSAREAVGRGPFSSTRGCNVAIRTYQGSGPCSRTWWPSAELNRRRRPTW